METSSNLTPSPSNTPRWTAISIGLLCAICGAIAGVFFGRQVFHLPGFSGFTLATVIALGSVTSVLQLKSISLLRLMLVEFASSVVMGFVVALFSYLQSINH